MGTDHHQESEVQWDQLYPTKANLTQLAQPITDEEVKEAIMSWPNNKAPGPDGFCGEFYKGFADILLPDIVTVFRYVMNHNCTLYPLNSSIMTLIPK